MIDKFKYTLIIIFMALAYYVSAQTITINYVLERTMLDSTTDENKVFEIDGLQNISYFDGLGRPIQQVGMGQSPTGADIVQIIDYDEFGRQSVKFMPYTATENNGAFIATETAKGDFETFYGNRFSEGEGNFTSITKFDGSPLNRPKEQGAPGAAWQLGEEGQQGEHTLKFEYGTNTDTDNVKRWEITGEDLNSTSYNALTEYDASTLYVNTTYDENQKATKEYKNKLGQVVLTESFDGTEQLRTYYIYEDLGLLRCIVPPLADGNIDDKLCYFYRYDDHNRMIEKKIPGAEAIQMVYDKQTDWY